MTKRNPKQERARRKVDEIIRTTSRIIEEGRFHEATTHSIAKEAGVGVGTIYEYFDSKEDIVISLLEQETRALWGRIEQHVPDWIEMDTVAALESFVTVLVDLAFEKRGLAQVMFGYVPGLMHREPVVQLRGQAEMLVKLLLGRQAFASNQEVRDTNAFMMANALIGVLLGIGQGVPSTVTRESLVQQLSRVFRLLVEHQEEIL
ncbi:MAG: TetR/AcrR family transcriptional regulator [Candidatus Dadabacteria bacterium]|nr:MAG: TetR/AcrR family transcriptional regulator [Candidatus Dadabacteria bacterium]